MLIQHRQGDLLFLLQESDSDLPKANLTSKGLVSEKARLRASGVLVRGETTGHAHRIAPVDLSKVEVMVDPSGDLTICVKEEVSVVHEEHKPIQLSRGIWSVRRQKEYSPDAWGTVRD